MFPNDAITVVFDNDTNSDQLGVVFLATSTRTILFTSMDSRAIYENNVKCDGQYILEQKSGGSIIVPVSYVCNSNINGNLYRNSFITITYVPYDLSKISTSTPVTLIQATSTASTTPQYINGFSYGEIIVSFLLLILVLNGFFGGILNNIMGKKVKHSYKVRL